DPWRSFFSTATGWGVIHLDKGRLQIQMMEGELRIDRLIDSRGEREEEQTCQQTATVESPLQLQPANSPPHALCSIHAAGAEGPAHPSTRRQGRPPPACPGPVRRLELGG